MPNGERQNPRYRKLKLTRDDGIKAIDLFNAPHHGNWNRKTREQLIKRYMRIGWNVVPVRQDKKPIMSKEEWSRLRPRQKLSIFSDQVFGIGMWIDDLVIFDFDHTNQVPTYDTLTTKSPHGYHCYFWRMQATRDIYSFNGVAPNVDTKTRGSFIVLPPTPGYEWMNLVPPTHLDYYPALRDLWQHRGEWKRQATHHSGRINDQEYVKYVLPEELIHPDRSDGLFRHARSFRHGRSFQELKDELRRMNDKVCKPPITRKRLDAVINRAWELGNDQTFFTRRLKAKAEKQ